NTKTDMMGDFGGEWDPLFTSYCEDQIEYINTNVASLRTISGWWEMTGLVMDQLNGLTDGYNMATAPATPMEVIDFYRLNMVGDWDDLEEALHPSESDE
ncbi:phospholipase B-like protein, partial [Kipferlia bialata]